MDGIRKMGTRIVFKLADLLEKNNMSLEELSRKTNISQQALIELAERKSEEMEIEHLNELLNILK